MTRDEITKVQDYLRKTFGNNALKVVAPSKSNQPVEVHLGNEFIAVLHRDEEDGEVSYDLHMTILDFDLNP